MPAEATPLPPMPPPERKRDYVKVIVVSALVLFVFLLALPYIAGGLFLAYLNNGHSMQSLSVVPAEHQLNPMPETGAGEQFQTTTGMIFLSPLASTSAATSSGSISRFTSGGRRFTILRRYGDAELAASESRLIEKMNILEGGGAMNTDFDFRKQMAQASPSHLFGMPRATIANIFLVFLKGVWMPTGQRTFIIHAPGIDAIQTTTQEAGERLDAGIDIYDKSGSWLYSVSELGLTQGEIDAFLESVKI